MRSTPPPPPKDVENNQRNAHLQSALTYHHYLNCLFFKLVHNCNSPTSNVFS